MTEPLVPQDPGVLVGTLADGPSRDYVGKLELFNRFAEPELRTAVRRQLQAGDVGGLHGGRDGAVPKPGASGRSVRLGNVHGEQRPAGGGCLSQPLAE